MSPHPHHPSSVPAHRGRPRAERDRASLLAQLEVIDVDGWDSPTGEALLRHVRSTVVLPHVQSQGLSGTAAAQAEATAWQAVWQALAGDVVRTASSPWGVLWVTAGRAVRGEVVAATWCTRAEKAWRSSAITSARHLPPVSLDEYGDVLQDRATLRPTVEDSPLIDRVIDCLTDGGWDYVDARRVVCAIAERATRHRDEPRIIGGWRRLAADLDMPGWQIRRIVHLLLGTADRPGLIERIVRDPQFEAASDSTVLESLRTTLVVWLPSPPSKGTRSRPIAVAS